MEFIYYSSTENIRKIKSIGKFKKQINRVFESSHFAYDKQLLDEVEHDIMNYQNRGLCYLPKPKAEADNTDTGGFDNS